jgi:hypothetical protein
MTDTALTNRLSGRGRNAGRGAADDAPSDAQVRAMFAGLGEHDIKHRADRLAFMSAVIGRVVDSSKNLTRTEAGTVLDALEQLRCGAVSIVVLADDVWELSDLRGQAGTITVATLSSESRRRLIEPDPKP